jgi:hypothetical protein
LCTAASGHTVNLFKIIRDAAGSMPIPISFSGSSSNFEIPNNLTIGTYVVQVENKFGGNSSFKSNVFLLHGNAAGLSNSTADIVCVGSNVSFTFQTDFAGIGRNYMGSKYVINYGDSSQPEEFTHEQLMANPLVSHIYNGVSCQQSPTGVYDVVFKLKNKGLYSVANASTYCSTYLDNGTEAQKKSKYK